MMQPFKQKKGGDVKINLKMYLSYYVYNILNQSGRYKKETVSLNRIQSLWKY